MSQDPTPVHPDELEQRQGLDGAIEDDGVVGDLPDDTPATPDVLEQQQVVEYDEDDRPV
ncbi:hypothetical protein [Egicoccus halophilus]|nr:hypothetical protein [Egicoccus halophilus]